MSYDYTDQDVIPAQYRITSDSKEQEEAQINIYKIRSKEPDTQLYAPSQIQQIGKYYIVGPINGPTAYTTTCNTKDIRFAEIQN
jgi:hypothetical protein